MTSLAPIFVGIDGEEEENQVQILTGSTQEDLVLNLPACPHLDALTREPEFLLRCAWTCHWDALLACCEWMLRVFSMAEDYRRSKDMQKYSRLARQQLMRQEFTGHTPLHATLSQNRPPLDVIRALLQCLRAAEVTIPSYTRDGRLTMLSLACDSNASYDVLELILDDERERMKNDSNLGSVVTLPGTNGDTPLTKLVSQYERNFHQNECLPIDQIRRGRGDDKPFFRSFLRKVELILRHVWESNGTVTRMVKDGEVDESILRGEWISFIHGAAYVAEASPANLMELLCRMHGEDDTTAPSQASPLHLLLASPPLISDGYCYEPPPPLASHPLSPSSPKKHYRRRQPCFGLDCNTYRIMLTRRHECLKVLLKFYGSENIDRFLFHRAVANGWHWHLWKGAQNPQRYLVDPLLLRRRPERRQKQTDNASRNNGCASLALSNAKCCGPLAILWNCNREALDQRDEQTRLYPFQLAASAAATAIPSKFTRIHDILALDTIYVLLRSHPQVIDVRGTTQQMQNHET